MKRRTVAVHDATFDRFIFRFGFACGVLATLLVWSLLTEVLR